jgi:dUTP pyrophosphatase
MVGRRRKELRDMNPNFIIEAMYDDVTMPLRGTDGSSGFDIHYYGKERILVYPHESVKIPTGLKMQVDKGYDICVYNRSSIASKRLLLKGAELIDHDYRGEVFINLLNSGTDTQVIHPNDKIAQIVIRPVYMGGYLVGDVDITERGSGGFGSTGR